MRNTKEEILLEALKLFAKEGYEAVSVRDIAGKLGITQGALYRHYTGKRDIFESILRRMEENDRACASEFHVPEKVFSETPEAYRHVALEELMQFTLAMFRYWTENEFASLFRRMLTLEQYRTPEMAALYQSCLGRGVLLYLEDIFRENGYNDPANTALRFFAPFYLLLNQYDAAGDRSEIAGRLQNHLKGFYHELL